MSDWQPPADWPVHYFFAGTGMLTCEEYANPESIVEDAAAVTCTECLELMHA